MLIERRQLGVWPAALALNDCSVVSMKHGPVSSRPRAFLWGWMRMIQTIKQCAGRLLRGKYAPNAGGTNRLGEASRARLQAAESHLPPCTTALCSRSRERWKSCPWKHRSSRRNEDGVRRSRHKTPANTTVSETSWAFWLENQGRAWRRLRMPHTHTRTYPHAASGKRAAWMARWLPSPTKQTDKRRAKIFMRLARVEQAAFGTGIRRASHCATTPLDFCMFSGTSGLSWGNGPGSIS